MMLVYRKIMSRQILSSFSNEIILFIHDYIYIYIYMTDVNPFLISIPYFKFFNEKLKKKKTNSAAYLN